MPVTPKRLKLRTSFYIKNKLLSCLRSIIDRFKFFSQVDSARNYKFAEDIPQSHHNVSVATCVRCIEIVNRFISKFSTTFIGGDTISTNRLIYDEDRDKSLVSRFRTVHGEIYEFPTLPLTLFGCRCRRVATSLCRSG